MKTSLEFLKEKGLTISSHVHSMSVESFSKLMEEYAEQFKPKWISVEERLPEDSRDVLCFLKSISETVSYYHNGHWHLDDNTNVFSGKNTVTHWMPMPEPPNT